MPFVFPRWAVTLALLLAVACLVWRHAVGQAPFLSNAGLNLLFDKWLLAPFRLLDLLALIVISIRFGPALMRRMPRLHALETLGAASLPVFCAHLVAVLLVLSFLGSDPAVHPVWLDSLVVAASLAALYGVARLSLQLDARYAAEKLSGPLPQTHAADAGRSSPSS